MFKEMPMKKKQRKTKFLKHDSLCMIAELEKGSYSDRRLLLRRVWRKYEREFVYNGTIHERS